MQILHYNKSKKESGKEFNMKKMLCTLLVSPLLLTAAGNAPFAGPYHSDGTAFYLVHPGGPLELEIKLFKPQPGFRGNPVLKMTPSALLTLSDPDEKIVEKKYWRIGKGETEKSYNFRFPNAAPGIWQLRNSFASNGNLSIEFKTKPNLKYGVLFSRCKILKEDLPHLRDSYFLVPPPLPNLPQNPKWYASSSKKQNKLHITSRGAQTEFYDRKGRLAAFCDIFEIVGAQPDFHGNSNRELPYGTTEIQRASIGPTVTVKDSSKQDVLKLSSDNSAVIALKTGETYQMNLSGVQNGYLTIDGFPVILCPDADTAKKINGSIATAPDGTHYAHKFQIRMKEWIRSLKKSDLDVPLLPITNYKKEWLKNPRDSRLLPLFAHLEHFLKSQETDPAKKEFGTSPLNIQGLALICSLDRPFNPYRGNRALMNRTFLYYFLKWLYLTESGVMYDDPEQGAYCGGTEWTGWEGMALCGDYMALAMMAPIADKKLIELWTEALRMQVHRLWNTRLTCENQSLHWPLKTYALYMATKDPMYLEMARDYIKDFSDPAMSRNIKTGYPMEAYGADATYPGISTSLLAFAARFSGDDAVIPVLKRIFNFMNHTVVREPDGSLVAANGFAHRTLGSWLNRQYTGGTNLLADRLEEAAAVDFRKLPTVDEAAKAFEAYSKITMPKNFEQWCAKDGELLTRYQFDPWIPLWDQAIFPVGENLKNAKLPQEKSKNFERNFNDEFLAKRTPSYYAFFYTGNYSWRRHNWRYENTPFPDKAEVVNGEIYSAHPSRAWMAMQGMNLFWTPKFGAFLTARNWTMYTQNLVRVEQNGKVVDFPTCYSAEAKYVSGKRLETVHTSKYYGLKMKRATEFKEDGLKVSLKISAPEKGKKMTLIEQLPFHIKNDMTISGADQEKRVSQVRISRSNGGAVLLSFNRPVVVKRGYDSRAAMNDPKLKVGLLEIVLAENFDGAEPCEFTYEIKADDSK